MKQVLAVRVGAKKAVGHIVSKKWWPTVVEYSEQAKPEQQQQLSQGWSLSILP